MKDKTLETILEVIGDHIVHLELERDVLRSENRRLKEALAEYERKAEVKKDA